MKVLQSELLKYKRTFTAKLITGIPLFFVLYGLIVRLFMSGNFRPWVALLSVVFNWWPVVFLPIGFGIFAVLVVNQEKNAGNRLGLLSKDVSLYKLWLGKIGGMAVFSFLSSVVLVVAVILGGRLTSSDPVPLGRILGAALLCFVTSLPLIPIQLRAATEGGLLLSMGIAFAGFIGGVAGAQTPYRFFIPWSIPTVVTASVIGVHPNGTILPPGDPLLDMMLIPKGVGSALIMFVLFSVLTGVGFSKKERL